MDISQIKKDFPIFTRKPELVYLDSTATSLKPQSVIDKEMEYYTEYTANVHRGIYKSAEKATEEYESTRSLVAKFIHANDASEIIFTRGTTEAINLVASTLGEQIVHQGDGIVSTRMEHHSNFVPWQQLALRKKTGWQIIDFDEQGLLQLDSLSRIISNTTKIVAFTAVSNTFGVVNDVKKIITMIRAINPEIVIVVDAAQAAPHSGIDVQDWDADFVAFSAHKMLGPSGVGVLWGKKKYLEMMPPYQFGGEMVHDVNVDRTEFKDTPYKFEAGTPNIAGVIAFKEAIRFIQKIGYDSIRNHEQQLRTYALSKLKDTFGDAITILGDGNQDIHCGIVTFTFGTYHAHDIAQILDESHIAVRAGHHCTMPLHKKLGVASSVRASFYIYNTESDVDALLEGLKKVSIVLK